MRVKRFTGDSIGDTMSKIKRELGSEAVILQTRQIKEGGFLGLFAQTKVEITAAIEEAVKPVKTEAIKKAYEAYREKEDENVRDILKENILEDTQTEIKQMHCMLRELMGQIVKNDEEQIPSALENWVRFLMERGISKEMTNELINCLKNELDEEKWNDSDVVFESIKKQIESRCGDTDTIKTEKSRTKVVALIGPTGVGKTTTIGKLAAGFSIIERRKVALITADTYRVAAVEQLRTFGEIIGVPVEVVMTPESLKEAVTRHRDKEIIFIDTAGRSPYHDLHMSELEAFIDTASPDLTMLVMSATTNTADQIMVYERFKKLSSHLILTKLDESSCLGSLLDFLVKIDLPVAYLTNGQNVPDDIEAATSEILVRYVLGEEKPNV